jgi:O-antigen ligase
VELTLPVGLALIAFRGARRDLVPLMTVLTIVPISAIILSGSRGGIISFGFEIGVLALLVRSRRALDGGRLTGIAIVGLAAIALVAWVGAGRAIEKFAGLNAQDISLSRRASMSRGAAGIFLDHPIKGSGLGTLVAVYPRYETAYDGRVVDHVHNDYVEMLAETGLLGGLCAAMFLWILYREAWKSFRAEQGHFSRGLHAGGIVALSGILVHSFVDFNLHIPANALLFLLQAYLATSPLLPSDGPALRSRRSSRSSASMEADTGIAHA